MKIAHKLSLAVGLPIALTWLVVLYATISSENSLSDAIEGASASRVSTVMEAIDRVMHSRIADWMAYGQDPEVQKALRISNRQFERLGDLQRHIDEIDLAWRTTPPESPNLLMEALSGNNLAKAMHARIETLEEANGFPILGEVFITNRHGANIAQTARTSDYRQDDENWWKLAKRDGLFVADVGFDESAGVFSTDVCLRIDDEHGVFLGILKAVLNIKEAVDIVKVLVGDNGNASLCDYLLFNSKKQIIYSSDPTMKFLSDGSPYFNGVVRPSHDRVFTTYRNAGDGSHRHLSAYAFSRGFAGFAGLDWSLLIEHDAEAVLLPVRTLRRNILLMALAATITAFAFGFAIAMSLSRRLQHLSEATVALGQGDLNRSVRIRGGDELTQLAYHFNKMAAELKTVTLRLREQSRSLERQNALLERHIIERKHAEHQAHRQTAVLQGINNVFKKSLTCATDEEIADQCLSVAEQLSGSNLGFVGELNREGRLDSIALTSPGWETCSMPQSQAARLLKDMELSGLIGSVLKDKQAMIVNDLCSHPDSVDTLEGHSLLTSFLGVPLTHDGKTIGMIGLANKEAAYDLDDQEAVQAVASAFVETLLRKRAEQELRYERDFAESLIETAQAIVLVLDTHGCIVRFNRYLEDLSGYRLDEVRGKDWFTTFLPDSDWNSIREQFTQAVSGIQTCGNVNPIITKDGRRCEIEWYDKTLRQTDETVVGVLAIGQDITERAILQNQLTQAQKLESIGQLAAGIAHEINTPTQYVGDNTRFLQDAFGDLQKVLIKHGELLESVKSGNPTETLIHDVESVLEEADLSYLNQEIPKAIEQALEGVERVAKIVSSMKEFSHPGSGEKTAHDINRALESTITVARNEWKYVAEMETDFDPDLPLVPCLPGELNQVFLNMIINAAHAISDTSGNGSNGNGIIRVQSRYCDDSAEIRISDTGSGIPENVRTKIFDPFFTTKEVGRGSGQGLAISHTVIVEKHGGSLDFETEEGKGTTFIIRLPLDTDSERMTQ